MVAEKEPSPFNPRAQMAHFLLGMGLRYNEQEMCWRLRHRPQDPEFVWTQEELEYIWAKAVPSMDLYSFGPKSG